MLHALWIVIVCMGLLIWAGMFLVAGYIALRVIWITFWALLGFILKPFMKS